MSAKRKLSIIIPCYNEEKNIPLIVERFKEALSHYNFSNKEVEIIIVDNGSTDKSFIFFERFFTIFKQLPALLGVPGPGEMTIFVYFFFKIFFELILSFLTTSTLHFRDKR